MKRALEILLVEDNQLDARLTEEALLDTGLENRLTTVEDGEAAISYLSRVGKYKESLRPDVVLLDLNLPKKDGQIVLEEMRRHPELEDIPVVVLTVSKKDEDITRALDSRMNYYMCKPVDPRQLFSVLEAVNELWQ